MPLGGPNIIERLHASPLLEEAAGKVRPPSVSTISIPNASARGLAILAVGSSLDGRLRPSSPTLVITPGMEEAERLHAVASVFLGDQARILPPWSALPFEPAGIPPEEAAERAFILSALAGGRKILVFAPIRALMRRVPERDFWRRNSIRLEYSGEFDPLDLSSSLLSMGYVPSPQVSMVGEFSRRGGILDLFPPGLPHPVRLEFDGDLIGSLRLFSIETQRSIGEVDSVEITPARELEVRPSPGGAERMRAAVRPSIRRDRLAEAIEEGIYLEGLEVFLPFVSAAARIGDLIDAECRIINLDPDGMDEEAEAFRSLVEEESREAELAFDPDLLFLSRDEIEAFTKTASIRILPLPSEEAPALPIEPLPPAPPDSSLLRIDLPRLLERRFVVAATSGAANLSEVLRREGIETNRFDPSLTPADGRVHIIEADIPPGVILPDSSLVLIGDEDLFGTRRRFKKRIRRRMVQAPPVLAEGSPVAHIIHGIGIYRGFERIKVLGEERDLLVVEYAGGDKVYVPPDNASDLDPYTVPEGEVLRLDSLGSTRWTRARERARKEAASTARGLLDLFALRETIRSNPIPSAPAEEAFVESFGFIETPDQEKAINDVLSDLEKEKPMDRLVVGDVGYGKTEIALRAAYRTASSGRQAALLAPTTILAEQHLATFRDRLAPFGIEVGCLSRLRRPSETKRVKEGLAGGDLKVVVGTHRILSKDIVFRNLGLVIIDEEQRFGVRHKERLKEMRKKVDCLTLSATPIPRTLQLALSGIRDMSVIETPPPGRNPVRTFVGPFREETVEHAIRRELSREGQVFYVHNRIETIERTADFVSRLVPGARIRIGHGAMPERELAATMASFVAGETDILVSTSIIENGLDIPRANTLICDRADLFGLSQLYQMRGRVGRSEMNAYAYFFFPSRGALSPAARKRLEAIGEHTALGAGFRLAMRDLEIRGAGEILGTAQSGTLAVVGYETYCRLLKNAVSELRGESTGEEPLPFVHLAVPAYIPVEYLGSEELVPVLYRELNEIRSLADAAFFREGLIDRFGPPPSPLSNLVGLAETRAYAALDGVSEITEDSERIIIRWKDGPDKRAIEEVIEDLEPLRAWFDRDELRIDVTTIKGDRFSVLRRLLRR